MEEGKKFDDNKLRYDLIPIEPLRRVAEVYTIGAKKYGDNNWKKGMVWSRLYGALQRHAQAWWGGEVIDKDNGQHHLASVVFNALALIEFEKTHPEKDDREELDIPWDKADLGISCKNIALGCQCSTCKFMQARKFGEEIKNDCT